MGHRRLFNTSQMFEMDHDQNPNPNPVHPEHSYVHLGMDRAGDNGSSMFPIENMPPEGINFAPHRNSVWRSNDHSSSNVSTEFPHWNSGRRSNDYTSSSIAMELPYYQPTRSGPTSDPVLHPPTTGSSSSVPPIYADHPSSSHYRPEIHGVAGSIVNPTMGNGRGPSKRKRPAVPSDFERGSTSRYYNAGSIPNSSDLHSEKPQHWPRDPMSMTPRYRGSSLSIAGEGSQRNVRSRSTLDLNLPRTYAPEFPPHHLHSTGRPIDHSGTVDLAGVSVSASTHEWNHIPVSPASRGRPLASDAGSSSRGVNQFPVASFSSDVSLDIGSFHHGLNSSRYPVVPPQSLHGSAMQPGRGGRSSHLQRVLPANGATASYPRTGFFTNSDHGPHMIPEVHPRHLRPVSMIGWHRSDRSGSSVSPYERLRSPSDEADLRDRYVTEGFSMLERSGVYSSRGFLDRHRDMRLDVDNMSYEELLDLGERIGTVNTGVSENSISKCLMETVYCSLDETQEQSNCVICLEEYKNKEVVGTLTNCGHEYHEGCIKKWLSMKNVCPICKAPVLKEK